MRKLIPMYPEAYVIIYKRKIIGEVFPCKGQWGHFCYKADDGASGLLNTTFETELDSLIELYEEVSGKEVDRRYISYFQGDSILTIG